MNARGLCIVYMFNVVKSMNMNSHEVLKICVYTKMEWDGQKVVMELLMIRHELWNNKETKIRNDVRKDNNWFSSCLICKKYNVCCCYTAVPVLLMFFFYCCFPFFCIVHWKSDFFTMPFFGIKKCGRLFSYTYLHCI